MQGLIFIPDMTGFTNFVNSVNIDLGVSIIQELLNEIINSNPLEVELSEIEGDAILYYKVGSPIPISNVFDGAKKISKAFNTRYSILKAQHNIEVELSLKFIVHYGNINVYHLKGFRQLYGETVIESHRLLKNGGGETNYILITDDYFNALNKINPDIATTSKKFTHHSSDLFTGVRKIGYSFFDCYPTEVNESCFARA